MKQINFNSTVKIQLSEFGKNIMEQLINSELASSSVKENMFLAESVRYCYAQMLEEDGYIKTEFWKIMLIFGSYMYEDKSPFCTGDFLIDERDIETYRSGRSL